MELSSPQEEEESVFLEDMPGRRRCSEMPEMRGDAEEMLGRRGGDVNVDVAACPEAHVKAETARSSLDAQSQGKRRL